MSFEKKIEKIIKRSYDSIEEFLWHFAGQAHAVGPIGMQNEHFEAIIENNKFDLIPIIKLDLWGYANDALVLPPPQNTASITEEAILEGTFVFPASELKKLEQSAEIYFNEEHQIAIPNGYVDYFRNEILGPEYSTAGKSESEALKSLRAFVNSKNNDNYFYFFYLFFAYATYAPSPYPYYYRTSDGFETLLDTHILLTSNKLENLLTIIQNKYKKELYGRRGDPLNLMEKISKDITQTTDKYPLFSFYNSCKVSIINTKVKIDEECFIVKLTNKTNPFCYIKPKEVSFFYPIYKYDLEDLLSLFINNLTLKKERFKFSKACSAVFFQSLIAYKENFIERLIAANQHKKRKVISRTHSVINALTSEIKIIFKKQSDLLSRYFIFFSDSLLTVNVLFKFLNPVTTPQVDSCFQTFFLPALFNAIASNFNYVICQDIHQKILKTLYEIGVRRVFIADENLTYADSMLMKQKKNHSDVTLKMLYETIDFLDKGDNPIHFTRSESIFLIHQRQKASLDKKGYAILNAEHETPSKLKATFQTVKFEMFKIEKLINACQSYKAQLIEDEKNLFELYDETTDLNFDITVTTAEIKLINQLIKIADSERYLPEKIELFQDQFNQFEGDTKRALKEIKKTFPNAISFFKESSQTNKRNEFISNCFEILNTANYERNTEATYSKLLQLS